MTSYNYSIMVKKNLMIFNDDTSEIIKIIRTHNDIIHDQVVNKQNYVYLISQDKNDPTQFTVISDPYEVDDDEDEIASQRNLIGTKLTFVNKEDFKRIFPEISQELEPVHLPFNSTRNEETGKIEGIQPKELEIAKLIPYNVTETRKNPFLMIELENTEQVGSILISWKYDKLNPRPYNFSVGILDEETKSYKVKEPLKNLVSDINIRTVDERQKISGQSPFLFEVWSISNKPNTLVPVKSLILQLNNDDRKINSILEVLNSVKLTTHTVIH